MSDIIQIGVCDDDREITQQIGDLIIGYQWADALPMMVHKFSSAQELLAYSEDLDLLYLDIELGDESGIDLLPKIQKKHPNMKTIFVTSHWKYSIHSHRLNVFQFLTKPLNQVIFYEELERFCQNYRLKQALYEVGLPGNKIMIPIGEIIYIEAARKHLKVSHMSAGKYEKYGQISREEVRLKPYGFIRCHKGFLVNATYIKQIKNLMIFLINPASSEEVTIPVSKSRINQVRSDYQDWLLERRG